MSRFVLVPSQTPIPSTLGAASPQANWTGMGFATHLKVVPRLRMSGEAEPPHLNLIYLHSTCRKNVPNFTAAALWYNTENKIFMKMTSLYFPFQKEVTQLEFYKL
jgi:hypothetical protein